MNMWKLPVCSMVMLLLGLLVNVVHASETNEYVLRFASPYSANASFSRADRAWMEMIEEKSNGRLRFETYWNGSLIGRTHTVQELAAGVADIGVISPVLSRAGMHLTQGTLAFYGGGVDQATMEKVFWELWHRYPELRNEYAGLEVLAVNGLSPMYVLTSETPVRTLADMRGLRLKSTADKARPFQLLGVDAVAMPMSEAYFALHRGILDGAVSPADTLVSLHFDEVIRFITLLPSPRPPYPSRAINSKVWGQLPSDLRELIESTSSWWSERIVAETEIVERRGLDHARQIGIEFIYPTPEDLEAFTQNLANEGAQIARELDAMSLPGTAMFEDVQRSIRSSGN